jgi:hypothetical protein
VNTFGDLEHALITGVVLGTLRQKGIHADVMVNDTDDATPYLHIKVDDAMDAVIVVLPPGE